MPLATQTGDEVVEHYIEFLNDKGYRIFRVWRIANRADWLAERSEFEPAVPTD